MTGVPLHPLTPIDSHLRPSNPLCRSVRCHHHLVPVGLRRQRTEYRAVDLRDLRVIDIHSQDLYLARHFRRSGRMGRRIILVGADLRAGS